MEHIRFQFVLFFSISVSNVSGLHVFLRVQMFRSAQTKEDQDAIYLPFGQVKEKNKRNTKAAIFATIICSEGDVNA